jgi:hypothetical protein
MTLQPASATSGLSCLLRISVIEGRAEGRERAVCVLAVGSGPQQCPYATGRSPMRAAVSRYSCASAAISSRVRTGRCCGGRITCFPGTARPQLPLSLELLPAPRGAALLESAGFGAAGGGEEAFPAVAVSAEAAESVIVGIDALPSTSSGAGVNGSTAMAVCGRCGRASSAAATAAAFGVPPLASAWSSEPIAASFSSTCTTGGTNGGHATAQGCHQTV